jgi:hypothetical protein
MILFLFYFFLAYLAYRLIFNFILPIYRTTKQVKQGFNAMKEQMNGQTRPNGTSYDSQNQEEQKKPNLDNVGEYIDFEDVK